MIRLLCAYTVITLQLLVSVLPIKINLIYHHEMHARLIVVFYVLSNPASVAIWR